jgi:Na+/proline symporter
MSSVILSAILLSAIIYLFIGYFAGRKNKNIADLIPIIPSRNARVETTDEFTSSTVATTVSLATIILAYFELSGIFGLYLLWTAITTAIGMYLVSRVSKQICNKMAQFDHQPSLHEFLGTEYNSKTIVLVASLCTTIGFLLIFATELIVGSLFLAKLVPEIPEWVAAIFLSSIGVIYTINGGFRAVIKTDQIQMRFIWIFIALLSGYYIYFMASNGFSQSISIVPEGVLNFDWRPGLGFFLFGLTVMNIPTHLSNMSIWQRIGAASNQEIVAAGLRRSIWSISVSWSLLALLACFAYAIVTPENSQALFTDLLAYIGSSTPGKFILFFVILGLYGAMLSTASTLLIVIAHTVSEDILAPLKKTSLNQRIESKVELLNSRIILFLAAFLAVILVEGLKYFGFSIADLVFSIYGGSLALFPLIMAALFSNRERLHRLSNYASLAVVTGFLSGWGIAILGKVIGNSNLIFLSPTVGISVSTIILCSGWYFTRHEPK